jgi:hypothetical protein
MTSRKSRLFEFFPNEDMLPGGKGDRANTSKFDRDEIEMGTKHELEHTNDHELAREIAIDHLTEDPHYYSDLKAAGRLFSSED